MGTPEEKSIEEWDSILSNSKLTNSLFSDASVNSTSTIKSLKEATLSKPQNLTQLRHLARTHNGLISSEFRRKYWPVLLGVDDSSTVKMPQNPHKDEHQVKLDINRSLTHIADTKRRDKMREKLQHVITYVLRTYPQLSYYQGYHDIVAVFVQVYEGADDDTIYHLVSKFTLFHLRDYMMKDMVCTVDQLQCIPELIKQLDSEFYSAFSLHDIKPFFSLSSILTFFSHDISGEMIFEIFDFLLSYNETCFVVLLLYSQLLCCRKSQLLDKFEKSQDVFDNEHDLVHHLLSNVFLTQQECIGVLEDVRLLVFHVSCSYKHLNRYSVLNNTSSKHGDEFSLEDANLFLDLQIKFNKQPAVDLTTRLVQLSVVVAMASIAWHVVR